MKEREKSRLQAVFCHQPTMKHRLLRTRAMISELSPNSICSTHLVPMPIPTPLVTKRPGKDLVAKPLRISLPPRKATPSNPVLRAPIRRMSLALTRARPAMKKTARDPTKLKDVAGASFSSTRAAWGRRGSAKGFGGGNAERMSSEDSGGG
jgi:hypothetical protein